MFERVGPKDVTILIRGETGTGKELIDSLVSKERPWRAS
jgi:transcriptional regulator with GAF, ATPase, and Fis domain